MKARGWIWLTAVLLLLAAIAFWGYGRWGGRNGAWRDDALTLMPSDASAVLFADLEGLRQAPFFSALYAWAPKPQTDAEYAQFQQATGFSYERDLDRACIAVLRHGTESSYFAVADGRFDRRKIAAYALQSGARFSHGNLEIFSVPVNGSARKVSFVFLRSNRIALTNQNDLSKILTENRRDSDASDWRTRFERLAGSPIFAVIRHESGTGSTLAEQAPGGFRSPQLSAALEQLQWITVAGKPDAERLQIVAEGEGTSDTTARQLSDLLNGVLVLAQAGLNDAKTKNQMDPAVRSAYLELVRGAEVSQIDRGETKAVRLVFDLTPKFLEAVRLPLPVAAPPAASNTAPQKSNRRK